MKKNIFLLCGVALLILSGCDKNSKSEGEYSADKALKFSIELPVLTDSPSALAWGQGDEVGIFPEAAKSAATKAGAEPAARFEWKSGNLFSETTTAFMPDESIPTHKFVSFYPFVEASDPEAVPVVVASKQKQARADDFASVKAQSIMYGSGSVSTPMDGATVRIPMAAATAILQIPVLTGEVVANRILVYVDDDAPYLAASAATMDARTGAISVTEGSHEIELSIATAMPASADIQYGYVNILPEDFTGKAITAEVVTSEGRRKLVFAGGNFAAGNVYMLQGAETGPLGYPADLSTIAFDKSYIYDVKDENGDVVGFICKEYLGQSVNQQAIVAYGITAEGKIDADNGLVAQVLLSSGEGQYMSYSSVDASDKVHGGTFSTSEAAYTVPGTVEAISKVWFKKADDGSSQVTAQEPEEIGTSTVEPETLVLSDREDTYAYKEVKIGKQVWMAENLKTTRLPDKTDILVSEAFTFYSQSQANTETGCKPTCIKYNDEIYYNGYCAGEFPVELGDYSDKSTMPNVIAPAGWKVPTGSTNGDLGILVKWSSPSTTLDADGNNITLFSAKFVGRANQGAYATTTGIIFWSASLNWKNNRVQGYFLKVTEGNVATAASANAGTTLFNGFSIRLIKKGAI